MFLPMQDFWCIYSSPVGPFGKLCSTYYRLIHGIETCVEADSHSANQLIHALGIQTLITIRTIRANRMHYLLSTYFIN
jgi:hypothetical protein